MINIKKADKILLILIILLGFILRIYGINWGLPGKDYYFSYQSDEVGYIRGLSQINPAKFDFNPRYFNWGTWHYFELGIFEGIAGFLKIVKLTKDKYFYYTYPWEMAKIYLVGRFLSIFFALGTILLVYLIGKKISNKRTGLLAAFFMAINPGHIIFSHYLKADASVTFWVTLLLLCVIILLETGKRKWYIFSGIVSAFAAASQHNGFCFIHSLFVAHYLLNYRKTYGIFGNFKNAILSKELLWGYLALILSYLIISPYTILSPNAFFSATLGVLQGRGGGIDQIDRFNVILDTLKAFSIALTPSFVLLGILGIFHAIFSKSRKILLVLIWLLPYLIIMILEAALHIRYQLLIFPGVFILSSYLLTTSYEKLKRKKYILWGLSIYILVSSLYAIIYSYSYDSQLSKKTMQSEASEWIVSNIPAGSTIGIPGLPEIRSCPPIIHQEYYYGHKQIDKKYKIISLDGDVANLIKFKPKYVVISKRDGFEYNYNTAVTPSVFVKELKERYKIIKVFEKYPSFFGFSFKPGIFISDWEIPFPVIYILQLKDNSRDVVILKSRKK